jgi:glycosyltransferase involved in cell wall biosynthesis
MVKGDGELAIEAQRSERGTLIWKWPMMEQSNQASSGVDVTVIMANYNGDKFVSNAIRSACNQSLRTIEIIVVDDASTDSSLKIIKSLAEADVRIRLIESSVNGGAAAARNRALDLAKGQWISIFDSDDLMHPDRLQWLIGEGTKSNADIVADDLLLFDADRRAAPQTLFAGRWAKAALWVSAEDYLATNDFYGRGPALGYLKPIFRSSIIAKRNFRYDERLTIAEDFNFVFQLLMAGAKFRTIPQIGYFYRRHSGSISHQLNSLALERILDVEKAWSKKWSVAALQPLFRSRERSIRRALAFDALVQAIKLRQAAKAARIAMANPAAALLLRHPLEQLIKRLRPDFNPLTSNGRQVCMLTRRAVTDMTKESSRYLLGIASLLTKNGFDVHLVMVTPTTIVKWPFPKSSDSGTIFKSIKVQAAVRNGRYVLPCGQRMIRILLDLLDRFLFCNRWVSPTTNPVSYKNGEALSRQDQLFIAREAPMTADVVIADDCFLADAFPYALRPDAQRIVIVPDSCSGRSSQAGVSDTSNSVISVPLADEIRRLARADTIGAIQRDEAAVLKAELPSHDIVVASNLREGIRGSRFGEES